jgi:hypothetical protein
VGSDRDAGSSNCLFFGLLFELLLEANASPKFGLESRIFISVTFFFFFLFFFFVVVLLFDCTKEIGGFSVSVLLPEFELLIAKFSGTESTDIFSSFGFAETTAFFLY